MRPAAETEAIVDGALVLVIQDADRAAVVDALADALLAVLAREAALEAARSDAGVE